MKKTTAIFALILSMFFFSCTEKEDTKKDNKTTTEAETKPATTETIEIETTDENPKNGVFATIKTSKGDIKLRLFYKKAPITVSNFVGLAEGTIEHTVRKDAKKYFDGLTFHRVVPNFVIQGGCPLGNGTGGPGYNFVDEFHPDLKHSKAGILSMANSGANTNGSQFFITLSATPHLDGRHSVFGEVVEGMDVVNSITQGDVMKSIKIKRVGDAAKAFKPDTKSFKALQGEIVAKQKAEQEALLEAAKKKYAKLKTTDSGLMYKILKKGKGEDSPKYGDSISCHYKGMLLDGTEFDSSYKRGNPLSFQIGQVIEGWNEALQTMKKGEKRVLLIPPELGYGSRGAGGVIPPNAYLIFEVELLHF